MKILRNGLLLGASGIVFLLCVTIFDDRNTQSLYLWIGFFLLILSLALYFTSRSFYDGLPVAVMILGLFLALPSILGGVLSSLLFCTQGRGGLGEPLSCPVGEGFVNAVNDSLIRAQLFSSFSGFFIIGLVVIGIGFILLVVKWVSKSNEKNRS
jgi:hypothetical protein